MGISYVRRQTFDQPLNFFVINFLCCITFKINTIFYHVFTVTTKMAALFGYS